MDDSDFKPLEVYCAEAKKFITPGGFAICPYFRGEQLDFEGDADPIGQVFRCHVKCGCQIIYRYRSGEEIIKKNIDEVADLEGLRAILAGVMAGEVADQERAEDSKPRILMVDDDDEYAMLVSSALRKRGFEVETAPSAEEALGKIKSEKPTLIVLDVMMEHFDSGFALSKTIRDQHGRIPTILLSAIGKETGVDFTPKNEEQLERMHADAFLDKGVSIDELVIKIRELLDPDTENE